MNVSKRIVVAVCLACLGYLPRPLEPVPARGAGDSMSESDFELMRSDIRTKKASLIVDRMKFTDQEAAAFWPVYRQYEADLAAINDKKGGDHEGLYEPSPIHERQRSQATGRKRV